MASQPDMSQGAYGAPNRRERIVARTYEPLLLYVEVGLIYLIFCTVLTRLQAWGEARLKTYGKR